MLKLYSYYSLLAASKLSGVGWQVFVSGLWGLALWGQGMGLRSLDLGFAVKKLRGSKFSLLDP